MENERPEIKPRQIITQAISKRDEKTASLLAKSVDEMLRLWNLSNIPSGVSKKNIKLILSSKN